MADDARKPIFKGLRTTKAQTSLRIYAVWSAPLLMEFRKYHTLHMYIRATSKILIFQLISEAEQAGLNLFLSETPKTRVKVQLC